MKLQLETEKLKELLENFYRLTKMRIVIFNNEFERIIAYPEKNSKFCECMKKNEKFRQLCSISDRNACDICRKNTKLNIYKCHAGLFEAVAPIKMNDLILGYIMIGQVAEKGTDKKVIYDYANKFNIQEDLDDICKNLPFKSRSQIEAASKIMESCTCYLWISELIKVEDNNIAYHLSNYIIRNIKEDLSVDKLCSEFSISRSKLYEITNKYYGMSIARYIKTTRLNMAAELLKTGNYNINKASESVGIYDFNYFTKIFKTQFGYLPSKLRK